MPIQPGTFRRLPPKEEILTLIEEEKRHNADLTSYLWTVMPLAERFGNEVYAVAAKSLNSSGIQVDASQLEELAQMLQTSAGRTDYEDKRRSHLRHVTG